MPTVYENEENVYIQGRQILALTMLNQPKLPSRIDFHETVLRSTVEKTFLLCAAPVSDFEDVGKYMQYSVTLSNCGGNSSGTNTLAKDKNPCDSSAFTVNPASGTLKFGQSVQVSVKFNPSNRLGHYSAVLIVRRVLTNAKLTFKEDSMINMSGSAICADIQFLPSSRVIRMPDTYLNLKTVQTFEIYNNSDVPVDFSWRAFSSIEDENEHKRKLGVQLGLLEQPVIESDCSREDSEEVTDDDQELRLLGESKR
jgi:hypothetical protein